MATLYYRDPADGLLKPYAVGPPPQSGRNRVINGDFSVNQRGFTSTTTPAYGLDRWVALWSGGTDTYSTQTPALGELPESARAYARVVTSGQSAAGDYVFLAQFIEGVRTLSGKTVTISFWAKSGSTLKVGVELGQNFGTGGSPSAQVSTPAGAVTTGTAWARYSVTVALPTVAGKTLGTANDFLGLYLWTTAGSSYATRASSVGAQNGTFDFWGVQVEEGSAPTPYEQKTFAQELRDCQRYFYRRVAGTTSTPIAIGVINATTSCYAILPFAVPMRVIPTIAWAGTMTVWDGIGAGTISAIAGTYTDSQSAMLVVTTNAALTAGRPGLIQATAGAYVDFNAEL